MARSSVFASPPLVGNSVKRGRRAPKLVLAFVTPLALLLLGAPASADACDRYTFESAAIGVTSKSAGSFRVKDTNNPQRRKKYRSFPAMLGNSRERVKIRISLKLVSGSETKYQPAPCFMRVLVGKTLRDEMTNSIVPHYRVVSGTVERDSLGQAGWRYVWTSDRSIHDYLAGDYEGKEIVLKLVEGSKLNYDTPSPVGHRTRSGTREVKTQLSAFQPELHYQVIMPSKWKYRRERTITIKACNTGFRPYGGHDLALRYPSTNIPTKFRKVPILAPLECYETTRRAAIRDIRKRTFTFMLIEGMDSAKLNEHLARLGTGTGYARHVSIQNIKFYTDFKVHHR